MFRQRNRRLPDSVSPVVRSLAVLSMHTSPLAQPGTGDGGGLNVYTAASGKLVGTLASGSGHWNSPIVVDGRIALPEGNANDHATSGVLDIWRVP